jgi:hypothetical protein
MLPRVRFLDGSSRVIQPHVFFQEVLDQGICMRIQVGRGPVVGVSACRPCFHLKSWAVVAIRSHLQAYAPGPPHTALLHLSCTIPSVQLS